MINIARITEFGFRDTVGTFEIAEAFANYKMITCIHKHYSVEEWAQWGNSHPDVLPFVAVSSGTSNDDFEKTNQILSLVNVPFICLDVANGYSEHVKMHRFLHVIFSHRFFVLVCATCSPLS